MQSNKTQKVNAKTTKMKNEGKNMYMKHASRIQQKQSSVFHHRNHTIKRIEFLAQSCVILSNFAWFYSFLKTEEKHFYKTIITYLHCIGNPSDHFSQIELLSGV